MTVLLNKFYKKSFCLNTEKRFFVEIFLKPTERPYSPLKIALANFKIALRLRDYHVFRWHSLEILNVINNLSLKKVFRKIKIKSFFKNLEYLFSVESTMIENATFSYKTALSKVNFMTNRIRSKNGLISKTMILYLTTLLLLL